MDPVNIVVIAVITLAVAPKLGQLAIYGGMKLFNNIKKKYKKHMEFKRSYDKKYQERMRKTREAKRAIERRRAISFKNTKTGAVKNVNVNEKNDFDLEKDVILKGKVIVQNPNGGEPAVDTIYLYQPRLYGMNNVSIGPKLDKKGHLYDENSYLLRTPGDPDIYRGYVPRREVMTGRTFDFVGNSANANLGDLEGFINIEIPKDEKGNFIPLDKKNAKEMAEFKSYIEKQSKRKVSQDAYLDSLISQAESARAAYLEANKPRYAKPTQTASREDMQKVNKARESQFKREAQKNAIADRVQRGAMAEYVEKNYGVRVPEARMGGGMPMGSGPRGQGGNPGGPNTGGPSQGGRRR